MDLVGCQRIVEHVRISHCLDDRALEGGAAGVGAAPPPFSRRRQCAVSHSLRVRVLRYNALTNRAGKVGCTPVTCWTRLRADGPWSPRRASCASVWALLPRSSLPEPLDRLISAFTRSWRPPLASSAAWPRVA